MRWKLLLTLILLLGAFAAGPVLATDHDPPRILLADLMERLNSGEDVVFLDTRVNNATASVKSKIPNAILVRNGDALNRLIQETPKERLIVTYCT